MNKAEAAALITSLVTAYPGAKFSVENAEMFESGIADLGAQETQQAIGELIHSNRFLPSIAEIRSEVVRQRRERVRLADNERALRLGSGDENLGPRTAEWRPYLDRMLAASARHQAMAKVWFEGHGKPCPPAPDGEFLELVQSAMRGDDVRTRLRREVLGDQPDLERRYP
jgi:hypothetical protein